MLPAWATPANNGLLDGEHLTTLERIGGGGTMMARAMLPAYAFLRQECQRADVTLTFTGVYRTLDQQKALWIERGGKGVAKPGTSMHGWGLAVDMALDGYGSAAKSIGAHELAVLQWIVAAWELPLAWDYTPDSPLFEPWHLNFTG